MKRLVIVLLGILCVSAIYGQNDLKTAVSVGTTVDNKQVQVNGEQMVFGSIIGGSVFSQNAVVTSPSAQNEGASVTLGFPFLVGYFPQTFDTDFFVSKGYFGEYVELRWNAQAEDIQQFEIWRKPLGDEGDSTFQARLANNVFSWKDERPEFGVVYKYTVIATGLADDLRVEYFNYVESDGFAFPTGSVNGRIAFEGGTAVEGVSVTATTDGNLSGKSVALNNSTDYLRIAHGDQDDELQLNDGFSVQLWAKMAQRKNSILFQKGDNYELTYDGSTFRFKVGDDQLDMNFEHPVDSFFHISAVYKQGVEMLLDARVSESRGKQSSRQTSISLAEDNSNIVFGGDGFSNDNLVGNLDEIRLWQRPLTQQEIDDNYARHISGNSNGLVGYWRLDMGIGNSFYDFSRRGNTFWENHGIVEGSSRSNDVPLPSQLSFRGLTNAEGNYTVEGFPFKTSGSLYKFTALKKYHSFDPPQQLRTVGTGSSIFNSVNFTDISSFEVSGNVTYKDSDYPVQGVSILVDGRPAINADGGLITTDKDGKFTIDVPIGEHSLRVSKSGHTFDFDGKFPKPSVSDETPFFNFQAPEANIGFVDNTLIKVAGRVVGGPVEEGKILGYGKSKNNIGNGTIVFETKRGIDITNAEKQLTYKEENGGGELQTSVNLKNAFIKINPDEISGEFVAYLPPEEYILNSVTAGEFDYQESLTLDLRNAFTEQTETVSDTLATSVNGTPIDGVQPLESSDYEAVKNFERNDTLFTVGIDTFRYQKRQDFIYRKTPSVDVVNANGNSFFGDESYTYKDNALNINDDIALYNSDNKAYTFNYPIFTQRKVYEFEIQLFEEYTNPDLGDGVVDRVPVVDGRVEVVNELSLSSEKVVLSLNEEGKTRYAFRAGVPNRSIDTQNPVNSFTKPMSITAFSGNDGAIQTVWREGDPFRGIVFGSEAFGNNFVTTGPNVVDYILRDPPGTNSFASIEKGQSITTTNAFSLSDEASVAANFQVSLGLKAKTFVGLGAGVILEIEGKNSLDVGSSYTTSTISETETEQTLTIDKTISTSDDPVFVGEAGDVFIGRSTVIVYGAAGFLQLIPDEDCTNCAGESVNGYRLGTRTGLSLGSEFATAFMQTQYNLENEEIPGLKEVRNSILSYVENPDDVVPTDGPIYVSKVPASSPKYGTSNTDKTIWGEEASEYTNDGPSYVIKYPENYEGKKSDTIAYYNKQISSWEFWLAENERQKVEAERIDNISFAAGVAYEESVTSTKVESTTITTEFTVDESIAVETGISVNGLGFTRSLNLDVSSSQAESSGRVEERTTTTTFSIVDDDIGDKYTIEYKKPKDGFGTVFSTLGGQTACPYEGEFKTRYFEPGKHRLHAATQKREGPQISANEAVIANVPDNRAANFTVVLSTNSETGEPFPYTLFVDPVSNPNGAVVNVNGSPIGNGLSFLVQPGETITQTVSVRKGRDDVFDYEDLRLLFVSECQFDPTEPQLDIADTARISAFFVPGCSEIELTEPGDNWILNTEAPKKDILTVDIGGYDLNLSDFTRFQFQYRAVGSTAWGTDMTFYNGIRFTQEEFDAIEEEDKRRITSTNVSYDFDMSSLPDQAYEIRAVAFCDIGPGVTYETPSDVLLGVKDTQRPQIFGAPQPHDGVLSANDEILIRFNEPIVEGKLRDGNFSVKGVLNNAPLRTSTSVALDGVDDYVRIENGLRLGNGSFTLEFKLRRNAIGKDMMVFSKGNTPENQFSIGFNEQNQFYVIYAGDTITSSKLITEVVNFDHYAVSYDAEHNELYAYQNDQALIEKVALSEVISGDGSISLGKSNISNDSYLNGNILDLRVWNRFLSLSDVFARSEIKLTGIEVGLIGYWPFDEAYGTLAVDLARFRNAKLFAGWTVSPTGNSYAFDGIDDYISMNTASTVVIGEENDFSIEMWMNGVPNQTNAVLFSSGRGTSQSQEQAVFEDPSKSISLGFNANGELYLATNGQVIILDEEPDDILDNDWHHLALTVSRTGSAIIFIDGEQYRSFSSDVIGGMIRTSMLLGARSTRVNTTKEEYDRFFNGSIDEFRIWNVARTAEHILLDRNARLTGEEFGLVAYYPFDEYVESQRKLNSTLNDQAVNANGPSGGLATAFGGSDFSSNTPNIAIPRPIKDVPYTFVVNNDEIVITPKASVQGAIERSTLEISVKGVEDLHGNRLASPISFTAFVNKNLVKWSEETVEIEKKPGEAYEFTLDIVNLGGNGEKYNISNLPLWLEASPSSGTISAQSSQPIKFTVNSGLNNGYYAEDLFLTTDFGFNEKLLLNMKVLESEPEWILDEASFEYSMSVVAQLEVEGITSRDENDLIAAYVFDELRGVAKLEYVPEFDQYMVFMDIFSEDVVADGLIEFRAFDADKGIEYRMLQPDTIVFEENELLGRPSKPILLRTGELVSEEYTFSPGFTWASFNLNSPQLDGSNSLFEGIVPSMNDRVSFENTFDFYTGKSWVGEISNGGGFRNDVYYLVHLAKGGMVDLVGTRVDLKTEIQVEPGFNRISYLPDFNLSVDEAFASLSPVDGDVVRSQFTFAVYEEGLGWIGSLKNLQLGQGYLYFSNDDQSKSFNYPSSTFLSMASAPDEGDYNVNKFDVPWSFDQHEKPLNMSMIIDLDADLPEEFVLAAFNDDQELVAISERSDRRGDNFFYLTVHGYEEATNIHFEAFNLNTGKYFKIKESDSYEPLTMHGSFQEPVILTLDESFDPGAISVAWPNPFSNVVTIDLAIPSYDLSYEILDQTGKRVTNYALSSQKKIREISWNGKSNNGMEVSAGIYLIKIKQAGKVETIKVIKID